MLELTNVTIISINCVDPMASIQALKYSMRNIKFKEAILFSHEYINVCDRKVMENVPDIRIVTIEKLISVDAYNDFVLGLSEHIDSDYVLIIQDDGYVLNHNNWDPDFLKYDYIGAPWPNEQSWIQLQQTRDWMMPGFNRVGNGGFSLRSRKFKELSSKFMTCLGFGEDAFLCIIKEKYMKDNGIRFANVGLATKFSYENNTNDWKSPTILNINDHFGFHGRNFVNSQYLIDLKK